MIVKPLTEKPNDKNFFGFIGVRTFVMSALYLPHLSVPVIFDTSERLIELNPIAILDWRPKPAEKLASLIFAFKPTQSGAIAPVLHANDYIRSIIQTMKSDAFLQAYNTLFYKIPKDGRPPVRDAVLSYLTSKIGKAQFDARMQANFLKRPRGLDPVEQIYDLVNSEQGQALKAAVLAVQKGGDPDTVSEASVVSAYEIRYVLSYLNPKSH